MQRHWLLGAAGSLLASGWLACVGTLWAQVVMPSQITSIEGITEYRLENGAQVLLLPDPSKSVVTVNMTVFVGSRHEGYGEAGMAHLLEHMLFKGTPSHANIPELLKNRGADFNGTTWLDRTNYFETLPAASPKQSAENLEFAIFLEADRLMNSRVLGEDLASEMTVVRSEFERGENSPRSVLMQRVQSVAYDWHNYGKSTIGNRSDIERVPIDKLQGFYRKYYRPDNVMLVVAGNFKPEQALELIGKYFGALPSSQTPLDRTYTVEPARDGERSVVLRRVGNAQYVCAGYHVPPGSSREFAAIEMLTTMFGTEPAGRLYQDLVVPELATGVTTGCFSLRDPGLAIFEVQVPTEKSLEVAQEALLRSVEGVTNKPITEEELARAKNEFTRSRRLRGSDTSAIAVELSEWAAQGDWRLYFLFRDYVQELTAEECTAVARRYFVRNNRTLGLFIPTEKPERVTIPAPPNLQELLADYKGLGEVEHGEQFDPDPLAIEAATLRKQLRCGLKAACLPKKTRGKIVRLQLNLRFGNEQSLAPYVTAGEFLPELLMRGTQSLDYQQLQDRLSHLQTHITASGTAGLVSLDVETSRPFLAEVLPLLIDIVRRPRLAAEELEVLRRQAIAATQSRMTDPNALAGVAMRRALAPFDSTNIRYVPTLAERIERYQQVSVDQLAELHRTHFSSQYGEIAAVGDFDADELLSQLDELLKGWSSDIAFQRIAQEAQTQVAGQQQEILTPDKANAVYYASLQTALRDDDPDYPGLVIGNYVLGGGALSSRLGDRVRQKEGLSYAIGSSFNSHPIDRRGSFTVFAITNPANRDAVSKAIAEELNKLLSDGITDDELAAARDGYLHSEQLNRSHDENLVGLLASTIFASRDLSYYANFEHAIRSLTRQQVLQALQQHLDPNRLVIITAGDFAAKSE
ncbi:MAG: insulinase family protein [Pirellulaceae bacterium]|nr:insulinase family protein [Pirellulaceae bacterium]